MPPLNQTPNNAPQPSGSMGSAMPSSGHQKSSVGPIIGAIIIVLVLILGGLYFWGEKLNKEGAPMENTGTPAAEVDTSTESLGQQGTSDVLGDIEADLSATDLNDLDKEAAGLDATFEQ